MTNLYKCKECNRLVPIRSKGLCPACREKQRREQGETTMQTRVHTKKDSGRLKEFFDRHIELLKKHPVSYESGRKISNPSRMNIAHLFPKRRYKSVMCEDNNVVYLTWQEHTDFDYYVDTRDIEKIETFFPKTWMAMKKVLPLVVEQGKLYEFVEKCIRDNE